jgi:hypothetical protein
MVLTAVAGLGFIEHFRSLVVPLVTFDSGSWQSNSITGVIVGNG